MSHTFYFLLQDYQKHIIIVQTLEEQHQDYQKHIIIVQTLEEQHQDYQKHIAVLKESLCAKEEHYTMLQTDVSSSDPPCKDGSV